MKHLEMCLMGPSNQILNFRVKVPKKSISEIVDDKQQKKYIIGIFLHGKI